MFRLVREREVEMGNMTGLALHIPVARSLAATRTARAAATLPSHISTRAFGRGQGETAIAPPILAPIRPTRPISFRLDRTECCCELRHAAICGSWTTFDGAPGTMGTTGEDAGIALDL
jgi:hypothetical protein